jgi:lysophospholipase L1-like esterase
MDRLKMQRSFAGCLAFVAALAAGTGVRADGGAIGGADRLGGFFRALDDVREGRRNDPVRIAWFGDSAIIADGYTREVRQALQRVFGDGGPGFILGEASFNGYLRDGVRMKRSGWKTGSVIQGDVKSGRYGYGGVVAIGGRGASLTAELKGGEPLSGVAVHVQAGPRGGRLGVFIKGARTPVATCDTAAEVVGDRRCDAVFENGGAHEVTVKVVEGSVRLYGVSLDRRVGDRGGVQVDPLGVLGIRARRWLNADAEHLVEQMEQRRPDLVVMNFGGNERVDAGLSADSHRKDIEQVIDALRKGVPNAACLVVGPLIHGVDGKGGKQLDPQLKRLYDGQRAAADSRGCAFIDTIALMGGHSRATLLDWRKKQWISGDYAHLTPAGHRELGQRLGALFIQNQKRFGGSSAPIETP